MAQAAMNEVARKAADLAAHLQTIFIQYVRNYVAQQANLLALEPSQSSTTRTAAIGRQKARSLIQAVAKRHAGLAAKLQFYMDQGLHDLTLRDTGSSPLAPSSTHRTTRSSIDANHFGQPGDSDKDWVFLNNVVGIQSDIDRQNANYNRWWYLRSALLAGLGITLGFATYRASRYATIVWCQRSIRSLQSKLDNEEVRERNRHDLEGFGFTYLWWINMMLSRD
jgi:hypothetical protein